VIVPDIERFGEKDDTTGQQNWEDLPAGSALWGLLLPRPPGKDYWGRRRPVRQSTICARRT